MYCTKLFKVSLLQICNWYKNIGTNLETENIHILRYLIYYNYILNIYSIYAYYII